MEHPPSPLPRRNRALATGDIVAHPARGLFMGNRGILHDDTGRIGKALWRHKAWIICRLTWKDRRRPILQPGAYTELFFLDEAVALAAGHRPCALCRREAYTAFVAAAASGSSAVDLDRQLHAERAIPRTFKLRRHSRAIDGLPDGAIILDDGPALVLGDRLLRVNPDGYGPARHRPRGIAVSVLTPPTTLRALANGYAPDLHQTAG